MGQGNKNLNRTWMKKNKNNKNNSSSNENKPLNRKEKKKYESSLKEGKKYTEAQLRFKRREAQGLSGLTGGKKGETIAEYRARQKKSVQDAAKERNKKFKEAKKEKLKVKKEGNLTKWQKRLNARRGTR